MHRYLEPINMVGENEATQSLLENWIEKEAREAKKKQKQKAAQEQKEAELNKAFGKTGKSEARADTGAKKPQKRRKDEL